MLRRLGRSTPFATFPAVVSIAAAGARRTVFPGSGDVHRQSPTLKVLVVKHFHGFLSFSRRGEFDEGEPARFAGKLIQHQVHRANHAGLRKVFRSEERRVGKEWRSRWSPYH